MDDLIEGKVFRATYPFVRTTYTEFDADGMRWKPDNREWRPRFAWFPVETIDGEMVWLEWVEKKFNGIARGSLISLYQYRSPR